MIRFVWNPVKDRWVVYHNDYARNNVTHILPDLFHVITNWFEITEQTANELNNIMHLENDYKKYFERPFSPFAIEGTSNNCRTLIIDIIKSSLEESAVGLLGGYLYGNPLFNDHEHGCIVLSVENGEVKKVNHHPCCWLIPMPCCHPVCSACKTSVRCQI